VHSLQVLCIILFALQTFKVLLLINFDFVNTQKPTNCSNSYSLTHNLRIFYQNVRGLRTKFNFIRTIFPIFCFYDIIIVTETWLTSDISSFELSLFGFQIFRLDRNIFISVCKRGGGVLIAMKYTHHSPFYPPTTIILNKSSYVFQLFQSTSYLLSPTCFLILPLFYMSFLQTQLNSSFKLILTPHNCYLVTLTSPVLNGLMTILVILLLVIYLPPIPFYAILSSI